MDRPMQMNIAAPAALIGDPVRSSILSALLSGRAEPASKLAQMAGVSAQAASNHLAKLIDGGLLKVQAQGRHRYYRLAGEEVAHALEALACLAAPPPLISPGMRAIRQARTCYSHLAGVLGVAVTDALLACGFLAMGADERYFRVTPQGNAWFLAFGVPPDKVATARRCLDCTERRWHLAGSLGVALLGRLKALGWVEQARHSRAVTLTAAGRQGLVRALGLDLASIPVAA
jgi:DNA-binding transcriptional ArsR family regulator